MDNASQSNGLPANSHHGGQERTVSLGDYLRVVYRGRWTIALSLLAILGSTAYYTFTAEPVYQASTSIMINEDAGMQRALFTFTSFSKQTALINNQVELLRSRYVAERVIDRLLASPMRDSLSLVRGVTKEDPSSYYGAVSALRSRLAVSPQRDTEFIKILMKGPTPFEAAYVANTMAEVYEEQDREYSRGEISQVVDFLEEQLEKKEVELKSSEETLKDYQEKEAIVVLSEEAQQMVNQIAQFETLQKTAETDLQVARRKLKYLRSLLGEQRENLENRVVSISSPLIERLREQMAQYERDIAVLMAQGVDEDYPDIKRLRAEEQNIKERLVKETQALLLQGLEPDEPLAQAQDVVGRILETEVEVQSLQARAESLSRIVEALEAQLKVLPEKSLRLARLERNRKVDENLYMMMKEKYEESRITKAGQIGKVRIVDTALPPKEPILPRTKLNLILGTVIGLGLGIGITFLMEYMDNSLRTIEDVERLGLSVIGSIPTIKPALVSDLLPTNGKKKEGDSLELRARLVSHLKPKSPISESYRTLRTNIQFSESDDRLRAILITSSGPGEGKSTTVANLAITMAQMGGRVLLVDTDLRRPIMHRLFGADKTRGLTNHLVGKIPLTEAIQPSGMDHLDLLTSGVLPPNPSEMLGSSRMKEVIEELKSRYDVVLFDSPPVIAVTDAAVLGTKVDGVLLVINSGATQREALIRAHTLLKNVKARIIGTLLNNVDVNSMYGSYYYYYYYHYYYSGDGDPNSARKKRRRRRRMV